jgi:hypothetical protein
MECGRRRRIMNGWADILIEKETWCRVERRDD